MDEFFWDKKMNIQTSGLDESNADKHHSPYEPTDYDVLFKLAASGYITSKNKCIDYGSGKGRVSFFLAHTTGCKMLGIEYDNHLIDLAEDNLKKRISKGTVSFICCNAEDYEVKDEDCFYFFNPFSSKILRTVLNRILHSYYDQPRRMRLFFYYPTVEYLSTLFSIDELICVDEIDCRDCFNTKDESERILIFEIEG